MVKDGMFSGPFLNFLLFFSSEIQLQLATEREEKHILEEQLAISEVLFMWLVLYRS